MASDLTSLIEKVEGLSGPSREVDAEIMALTYTQGSRSIGTQENSGPHGEWEYVKDRVWIDPKTDQWVSTHPYEFTRSIDAALPLVERMLPGWSWRIGNRPGGGAWGILGTSRQEHLGATPALALILALLRALQSQGANNV